jgi:hypothetical protein
MSQSKAPPPCLASNSTRRTQRPSPIDRSYPRKRQRQSQRARSSSPPVPSSPQSAGSAATNISQYYGIGDEDTLGNLFASFPLTLTTFPQPHGSQGLHEPSWELRFDHEIYLSNDFLTGQTQLQRVRIPIPGPETDLLPPPCSPPQSTQGSPTTTRAEFQSALKVVREVVGEGRRLTIELAQSYE